MLLRTKIIKMYKNMECEMRRQGVTIEEISRALNIDIDAARLKLDGKNGITAAEALKIAKLFRENNGLSYLFSEILVDIESVRINKGSRRPDEFR